MGIPGGILDIGTLADLSNIGTLFAFVLVSIGVIILRYKQPERRRGFRAWGTDRTRTERAVRHPADEWDCQSSPGLRFFGVADHRAMRLLVVQPSSQRVLSPVISAKAYLSA